MPHRPENDPALRDRVSRLMGVLRQLAVARSSPVTHTDRYLGIVWLGEAQQHSTVHAPTEPGEEVLRVPRVQLEPEPAPSRELTRWVDRPAAALAEPTLRPRGPIPGVFEAVELDEAPEIRHAFDDWMRQWRPWADRERLRRPRLRLFEQLFDLHRMAADRPESVELVAAAGLLYAPGEDPVRVHLVTQPVRIDQDPKTGDMVCALVEESAVRLEDDELLAGQHLYDPSGSAVLRERLLETADSPLDPGVPTFLKEWAARALRVANTVTDDWDAPSGREVQLAFAPALVARRRSAFALREYYDAINRSLADESEPVPLGLAQLVEPIEMADRIAWLERTGAAAASTLAQDPLFPLPANEAQAQIIDRLGHDSGVVVEGPPGTGKTHTIANLVSALLAQGQRVLVTSEKAQALRVLRDKLPEQMRELCVSLTDATARGNSDLARSVATLAGAKTDFNAKRSDRRITDLTERRETTRRTRARLLEDIRALRESETYEHSEIAPGYAGTLARIARALGESQDRWVPGDVAGELPLSGEELGDLLHLLRGRTDRRASRHGQQLPTSEKLPVEARVRELAAAVADGQAARTGEAGELVTALGSLHGEQLLALEPACRQAADAIAALRGLPAVRDWALWQADMLLSGNNMHLWQRAIGQLTLVETAVAHDQRAGFLPVHVTGDVDPAAAAPVFERLAEHLASGKTLRRMFKSAEQKDVERYATSVQVSGAQVTTADGAAVAAAHLRVLEIVRALSAAFAPLQLQLSADADRSVLVERMLQLRRACGSIREVLTSRDTLGALFEALPVAQRPRLSSLDKISYVVEVAVTVTAARNADLARAELDAAADELLSAAEPGARCPEAVTAVEALQAADAGRYVHALGALATARTEQRDQQRCDELADRLRRACPALHDGLIAEPRDAVWSERLPRWPQAWARACAAAWIAHQTAPGREQQLEDDLAVAVRDLGSVTADLAAQRAWRSCLSRMTAEQVQALQSYRNHLSNVGKGTGKHAERFRQAARQAMTVAQEAVPAWVMPIQQVLASVPAQPGAFDVVIVDEASQAELTSTFLLWLAPRVIVVGDDKQCSPSEISSGALEPIFARLDTELSDVPSYLRAAFTPRDSIFSLLRSRFGQVVRLREHFRCMPEIITWSSNEFYRDAPLEPVRQFGADRLPPLRTTYVEGAYHEGSGQALRNPVEADEIADSIAACLDDPAYEGRTFGVVVLQGQAQADLIRTALHGRVSAEQWEQRRLRVGTPPDFQGDERHVVWLSLVVTPDQRLTAQTRREMEQRYNVAASRAQDQLWLFHSVTADLLRPADLRYKLLNYMTATDAAPVSLMLGDVSPDRKHDAFDSLFEQRVFLALAARGYHVTPQMETNGRRIDLVVTGSAGTLAVECDGDAFHTTPEQRMADLQREQELKRCGWTFVRVRESSFYLDRERALAPVWAELDRLGIDPFSAPGNEDGPVSGLLDRSDDVTEDLQEPVEHAPIEPEPEADQQPPSEGPSEPVEPMILGRLDIPAPSESFEQASEPLDHQGEPARESLSVEGPPSVQRQTALPQEFDSISEARRALLLQAAERSPLSSARVAGILAIHVAEARALLAEMVADGLLVRTGNTKGTRYLLPGWSEVERRNPPEGPPRPPRSLVVSPTQRSQVLRAVVHRPLTNEVVRKLLDVDAATSTEILTALVEDSELERKGQGRGTYYVQVRPPVEPSLQPASRQQRPDACRG
ncbi:MAG: AAA domain-containing protein [Pseudonocardiaceae bacterium]